MVEDQKSETQKVGVANKGGMVKLAVTQSNWSLTPLGKLWEPLDNRQYIFRAIPLGAKGMGYLYTTAQQPLFECCGQKH